MSDYSKMKVAELKELLKEAGLPVSGKKADLIARLEEDGGHEDVVEEVEEDIEEEGKDWSEAAAVDAKAESSEE